MTTHVVCLDGTGQTLTQTDHPVTNIGLIFKAMGGAVVDADNGSFESTLVVNGVTVQVGKYLSGVGTTGLKVFEIIDQGTGLNIAEQIVRGYTFLSRNYQPGDDMIIVGFSRGAAAARCLAGFVVGQGLLNPATYDPEDKQAAYLRGVAAWYQYRDDQPWLAGQKLLTDVALGFGQMPPQLTPADYVPVERILAVGVFDTVSSMGLPQLGLGTANYVFNIADTNLSPKVLNGYHALAADENRDVFLATYWTPRHNITQVVFPGVHSDVGGGYVEYGLSDRALQWMLPNLAGSGLRFDLANIRALAPDAKGVGHDDSIGGVLTKPREFPTDAFEGAPAFSVDRSLGERWGQIVTVKHAGGPTTTTQTSGPYAATGVYVGGKALYP